MDRAETLWIDIKDKSADVKLRAIMLWPHDPVARNHYCTTYAQLGIESVGRLATQTGSGILRRALAHAVPQLRRANTDTDTLASVYAGNVARGVQWAAATARAGMERDLLDPAGGYASLREAPGVKALRKAAETNRKLGAACGETFLYVVMMVTHHQDLDASLNRAREVMKNTAKLDGRTLPPERNWTIMWKTWQAVGPLWAAEALCRHAARIRGERWILRESLAELVATSHWLIDFGLRHVPKGSHEGPFLREDRLVIIDCDGVSAREPEIPRLTEQQLDWARAYRSPAQKPATAKKITVAN
jgi:hypothetical protein